MNPTASLIAELCDGRRSLDQIEALVERAIPGISGREVRECIRQGEDARIFTTRLSTPPPGKTPAELSRQLREDGKIEAAYICRYAAAELDPGNPEHWAVLGELAHILGRRADARRAYERYAELEPNDAETRHLLIALRDEPPPPRASNEMIQQLYERFSTFYESNVVEELDYQAPKKLAALVGELAGGADGLAALDLGCGSGLAGVELRPLCRRLAGIDLSPQMVELARQRGIYDALEVAELGEWLAACEDKFDLIVACDTLIYFGDLRQALIPAAALLNGGGVLAFSVEKGGHAPFRLNDNGRYSHHPEHVREVAAEAGLLVERLEEGYLRMEYGEEVTGLFVALRQGLR